MKSELYIFGASTNGEQCLKVCREKGIAVLGFLDNFTEKAEFNGIPVLRPAEADRCRTVVVTSPCHCLDITLQLDWLGFGSVINLSQFYRELDIEPDWEGDLAGNRHEYEWVRARLGDHKSIAVFDAVVKFRKTLQPLYTAAVRTDIRHQWFDPEFFKPGPHVFIDGGAYDGDTAAEFIRRCPGYRAIHLFEPSAMLADAAKKRLSEHRDVHVWRKGLSDREAVCHLQNAGLPGGKVGIEGEEINLLPIDKIAFEQPPTFIKLDVEGCEAQAILGAEQTIRKHRPFIACAVYHRPEDIWQVPQLLSGMQNYKFYLRHYTQFYHETVLYCI